MKKELKVYIAGTGAVFEEKMVRTLAILGSEQNRYLLDIDIERLMKAPDVGVKIVGDCLNPPIREVPENERAETTAVIATPDHLGSIIGFIERGVRRFIVEKPLVNNNQEVEQLKKLITQYPDLQIYALDFYIQKCTPLLLLAGTISPEDPRSNWVRFQNNEVVPAEIFGSIDSFIGKIEGISVTIVEGGKLGVPDVDGRSWLERDKKRGGVLLDLAIHAIAPLVSCGLVTSKNVNVIHAERKNFGEDRRSFIAAPSEMPEMYAHALLSLLTEDARNVPIELTVGKIFQDGGIWEMVIRGSQGNITIGLRSGQHLSVQSNGSADFQLSLDKTNDPYALAFQEAKMYFEGRPGFDGNLKAALESIAIIEEIKRVS